MKRILSGLTIGMLLALILAGTAAAAGTSGSASIGVQGTYVWRGQVLSDAAVIQPSVSITDGPVSFGLWGNYDIDLETLNETDLTISYGTSIGDTVSVSAGYIYYGLEGAEDTQEIYATVAASTFLSPSLSVFYDFDEGDGAFAALSVGHSFALPRGISVKLGGSASYAGGNAIMGLGADGDAFSGFYSGEAWVSAALPLGLGISVEPRLAYSFPLSGEAGDILEAISPDGEPDTLYGGLTLSVAF